MADEKPAEEEGDAQASARTPEVVCVFLDKDTLVQRFKEMTEAVNTNSVIRALKGDLPAITICKKKSGFTRHLFLGDLESQPFEYTVKDWEIATQRLQHLPDLVIKRRPGTLIVVAEEPQMPLNVIRTVYADTPEKLEDKDVADIVDAIDLNCDGSR